MAQPPYEPKSTRVVFVSRVRLNPYVRLLARGVHAVSPRLEVGHTYFLSLRWVLRHARSYDILHIHWIEHLFMVPRTWQRRKGFVSVLLALLLARLLKRKIVYTVHNLNQHEGRSPILNRIANAVIFKVAHAVHVHDETVAQEVSRRYGRRHNVFVIPHGSYLGAYPNEVNRSQARAHLRSLGMDIEDNAYVFLFLGQVRPYKGIELLIRAFRTLDAPHARLLIVGKAEAPAYADEIRALAEEDPRIITHLTYVADEDLQYFFNAADVCVLPYRHITTSGAALLAFTFGKPIIAPALGPFVELAADGRGMLYAPEDEVGLAQALRRALAGELRGAESAVTAFARAHNWTALAREHVRVYERLLCRPILQDRPEVPPVVVAGRDPWEGPWRNRQQIMSRLARQTPVLYVNPRLYARRVWRGLWRHAAWRPRWVRPLPTSPDLHVLTLPVWASRVGRSLGRWSDRLARGVLQRAVTRMIRCYPWPPPHPRPVLWLTAPDQVDFLDMVATSGVVYHVVDDYTAYEADHISPERLARVQERHEFLLRAADMVICTHPALAEKARAFNSRVHLVPNAVDWHAFQRALACPQLPEDVAAIPRPRVGYVGVLNDKIDLPLLRALVDALSDVHLVLVGPNHLRHYAAEWDLLDHPRVHWLGFRPPQRLPLYMKGLDVALMPYRINRWTAHIDPLKLYEYFAVGMPVVSTRIPAVRSVAHLLYVAEANEFPQAVQKALAEEDVVLREQRRAFARRNTWEQRVALIARLLQSLGQDLQEAR